MDNAVCSNDHLQYSNCYKLYYDSLIQYVKKIVLDYDVAEEVVHDVFVKLYERNYVLESGSSNSRGLLFKTAKNAAFDYLRKQKREKNKYKEIYFEEVVMDDKFYNDLEDLYIEGEIISTIHDVIDSFADKEKTILVEKYYERKNMNIISQNMNMSKYMVKQLDKEFHAKVRIKLKDYYYK